MQIVYPPVQISCGVPQRLIEGFENLCDWFFDNKLSLHLDEKKTKSIIFASKWRAENIHQLNSNYKDKYKIAFESNIPSMCGRQNDVRRANCSKL